MPAFIEIPLILLGSIAAILLIVGLIEPHLLKIEKIYWDSRSSTADSEGSANLRLVLLSDLHTEYNYINRNKLLTHIKQARPDLILFAGDWTGPKRKHTLAKAYKWQIDLVNTARDLAIPFIAIAGNHDDDLIRNRLLQPDSGIKLLINEAAEVSSQDGSKWQIIGIDDLKYGQPGIPDRLKEIPASRTIMLAHNPDMLIHLSACPGDFFLSGHFHGGQIWAPGNLEFKLFRREKIAALGFRRGEFSYDSRKCYISRGLGCVVMPIRLFSLPEITIIEIKSEH